MPRHVNGIFEGVDVPLDGNEFIDCIMIECRLIYGGGTLPKMDGCKVTNSKFIFAGSAENTIGFLRSLYNSGFKPAAEEVIAAIKLKYPETPPH